MSRKKRTLTDEEQSLWNRITEQVKPLKADKEHAAHGPSKARVPPPGASLREKTPLSLPPETPFSPPNHRIQRVRKVTLQARLDLHGLTREQARLRLAQFLVSCQEQRRLWVLVITGKGQRNLSAEAPCRGTHAKKTLRELVPQWLEEPDLRSVVSAYATAKPQDGGSGALYVRLKRVR